MNAGWSKIYYVWITEKGAAREFEDINHAVDFFGTLFKEHKSGYIEECWVECGCLTNADCSCDPDKYCAECGMHDGCRSTCASNARRGYDSDEEATKATSRFQTDGCEECGAGIKGRCKKDCSLKEKWDAKLNDFHDFEKNGCPLWCPKNSESFMTPIEMATQDVFQALTAIGVNVYADNPAQYEGEWTYEQGLWIRNYYHGAHCDHVMPKELYDKVIAAKIPCLFSPEGQNRDFLITINDVLYKRDSLRS